jgi:hypothetical protein
VELNWLFSCWKGLELPDQTNYTTYYGGTDIDNFVSDRFTSFFYYKCFGDDIPASEATVGILGNAYELYEIPSEFGGNAAEIVAIFVGLEWWGVLM